MAEGQIRKAISGFYYVEHNGELIQCKSRGVFRLKKINPLVGDFVTYVPDGENDATITGVEPRKSELVRPPIANVDQVLLVFSVVEPDMSLRLLDRFLAVIESHQLEPILYISKEDIANQQTVEDNEENLAYYQRIGYTVLRNVDNEEPLLEVLRPYISGKTTVLAGQSGVGKSTLLNTILPELQLKTGVISDALGRGKHTTRHVELLEVAGGLVADTPGFSSLDFDHIEKEELRDYFVEMAEASEGCKFRGCLHLKEPGCAVKAQVEEGLISESRYKNYLLFMQEIMDRKPRY
ncbi:ribosome small subunit-dependent GTPase A [Sporosarcina sp. P37]|uniref:ribosome small subunit-dependent GTPase A n=1 Tax=unclassified Sporosarcina TaxID=2647733 RepID=UPI0009C1401D|nr:MULTISPECIES: ribosome small subunit-dependent GTPase A [unclassified Sporosarcina]ARD49256.1 ribosome small subunit-dependent GTPase A [Sporosarcina sp. P33]ARK25730.1 ribosome small subunit-dependent GTPase A [Sporosarcina sp. P37]PID19248.1 ribosome small subunit-dependent GTPase A [Sporosarcina sp. P35]